MDMQSMVEECGCDPVGPAATLDSALNLVRSNSVTGAILDINLGSERVWPVADLLAEHKIPFLLATGYTALDIPATYKKRLLLTKPLTTRALRDGLRGLGLIAKPA
jgi:hypothetical protein